MELEQTIATYLFLHNECSLPGIGTLRLVHSSAEVNYPAQEIKAPAQTISFSADERTPSVSNELLTASQLLKIKLDNNGTAFLKSVGTFSRDKEGHVHFTPISINKAYAPTLSVPTLSQKKVVQEKKVKQGWWLWALVLTLLAAVLIVVYCVMQSGNPSAPFGNSNTLTPPAQSPQYRTK